MKNILVSFLLGLFIIAINLGIKIFNTFNAWLGIIIGVLSVMGLIFLIFTCIKSILKDKEK